MKEGRRQDFHEAHERPALGELDSSAENAEQRTSRCAGTAGSARATGSAGPAGPAGPAGHAGHAGAARRARNAWRCGRARHRAVWILAEAASADDVIVFAEGSTWACVQFPICWKREPHVLLKATSRFLRNVSDDVWPRVRNVAAPQIAASRGSKLKQIDKGADQTNNHARSAAVLQGL